MCLNIYIPTYKDDKTLKDLITEYKQTAGRDLHVFKMVKINCRGKAVPYYQDDGNFEYKAGFHYYQTGKHFSFKLEDESGVGVNAANYSRVLQVYEGLHAFTSFFSVPNGTAYMICTIPKGSKYFLSSDSKEIVANNLIVNKIITKIN